MVTVNKVNKVVKMDKPEIIRFQIVAHCELSSINLFASEIECLALLAQLGKVSLLDFCNEASDRGIFEHPQAVRNVINKLEKLNLVKKYGEGKKVVEINPDMKVETVGNIMLDFKFLSFEPKES